MEISMLQLTDIYINFNLDK